MFNVLHGEASVNDIRLSIIVCFIVLVNGKGYGISCLLLFYMDPEN